MNFIDRMTKVTDRTLAEHEFDSQKAQAEGWDVFEVDNGADIQIQALDDPEAVEAEYGIKVENVFGGDQQAWSYVVDKARQGSKLHLAALKLVSDGERAVIKAHCGDWED